MGYKCIYEGGMGEIEEKKSRFICHVQAVETEEDAVSFINEKKKEYWDVKHNCYAFVIGKNAELTRCSDDGEPSGTAGRPMLSLLLSEKICNVVVVVTRYFGGVLLGTGGLVRAYQAAVSEGLKQSVIIEKKEGIKCEAVCDYNTMGRLQYIFAENKVCVMNTEYADNVIFTLVVDASEKDRINSLIVDATSGTITLTELEECTYAAIDGEVVIF